MANSIELSEAKRALLEKYLRGGLPPTTTGASSIPQRSRGSVAPLSFGQQQLWLLAQLLPNTPMYNECVTIHLPGLLDVAALEQSFTEILRRHEAWRTSFPTVDGQPVQMIHPVRALNLPVVDLCDLPEAERETEALRLAAEDARRPFDLAQGPLLRTILMRLGNMEHRLFLTLHHIIFDGYSLYQVFLPELHALYEAFSTGRPSPLADLPIQYADFATWQRESLQGDMLANQLAYWKKQLEAAPATLELPTDRPRPPVPTSRGSIQPFVLSKRLTGALKDLSRQEGVTLYMTLLGAFNTLLHRYTGQDDILIGTAISNRKRAEVQKVIGFFLNTLVLRTDLSGNPTFRELLRQVREVTLEAHAHQDVPFEYLVKERQPERNLGQNPLFQVMLTLEPPLSVLPSGWTMTQMDVKTDAAKFDLFLELDDRPEGLVGHFEYNTDLFDAATIARMAGHWQTLLEGIVNDPEQRLQELPLLRGAEQHQLLVEWNDTQTAYPRDQCVHQLFESQVERSPDAVALVFENQQVTYRDLDVQANQLACHLRDLGVEPGVLVGLCMDRSIEMVVGLLGILKAGGAYVPLDPAYPRERLAFMLQDTHAKVLLTQQQFIDLLPAQGLHVICLDTAWKAMTQERTENLVSKTTSEDLAYVMYTSGSTGRPKGVEVRHRSIIRLLFGVNYVRLDDTQTILHMAPISFDAAPFEVWGALLYGARCILFPERVPTPKSIGAIIHKHSVTTVWLTASLFNTVIDEAPGALTGTRQVLTGGEALSVVHIRRALDLLPSTQLINGYGPTESTTFTCCYPIPRQLSETTRSIPIGKPIGNTQVYVLDQHLQPVPTGVAGELHIGGAGLARGYLNRPELTGEKFIPHPFSAELGARLYKTGDLVRCLPDGTIEFLGRLDHQVKIRGFRIEPGEIEAVLGHHPAVREALVLACENERSEKSLVAYVVPLKEQNGAINELQRFLKEQLPEYMVPSDFVLLDSFPLTPNGKIDQGALPAPEIMRSTAEETFVAPMLMVHQQFKQIWEDLLNVRPIGIRDNFFSLGGHSLLAARLVDRIEQVFRKKIPLATLFAGPTIEQLADALQQQEDTSSLAPLVPVQTGGARRPFFFLHGDWKSRAFYCFTLARALGSDQPFYVLEPYKFDDLQALPTLETMAAAHIESLRTFHPEGPYLLGGFCNGGLIAYEMARQLHAQGQVVDLLVLIDPSSPALHRLVRGIISHLGNLMHYDQDKQLNWFLRLRRMYLHLRFPRYRKNFKDSRQLGTVEKKKPGRGRNKVGVALPGLDALVSVSESLRQQWPAIYRWISGDYVPGLYPGKITFFWSREDPFLKMLWRAMPKKPAQEVEVHVIPGTHITCRTEHLPTLAEQLRICLSHVQE